jgi:YggT family protein
MEILFEVLRRLIDLYYYALIIYILMSWFPNAKESSIGRFFTRICEPYLEPFRKIIPSIGMIDISPIVAILVLRFASSGLVQVYNWIV